MKFLLAALLLLPSLAFGQGGVVQSGPVVPGNLPVWLKNGTIKDSGQAAVPFAVGPMLNAANYGVKANGTTPDDAAMVRALTACQASGAALWLPPGQILLNSPTSLALHDCALIGSGILSGSAADPASMGTTFLLTSTTTAPFLVANNWSITGVNFYWPNQTNGTTVYPPLFRGGDAGVTTANWFLDHVQCINAYQCWLQVPGGGGIGTGYITNSSFYAVKEAFSWHTIGNSVHFDSVDFTPGSWWNITRFSAASLQAVDAAVAAGNKIFHFTNGDGINVTISNTITFDWGYGFFLDSGAIVGVSDITMNFDGMATLIDASSGGIWAGIPLRGENSNCAQVVVYPVSTRVGHPTCFKMGANSVLNLDGFYGGGSWGSYIETSGSNVTIRGGGPVAIGKSLDGGDYYAVHVTGNTGGTVIDIQGAILGGNPSATNSQRDHVHGVVTDVAVSRLILQNNHFEYFYDPISIDSSPTTIISGNWSIAVRAASSVTIRGTNPVQYLGNHFEAPPLSTLGVCTVGGTVTGAVSGFLHVCSTNPTSTFTFTLPWVPLGNGSGSCIFVDSLGVAIVANPSTATMWTLSSVGSVDIHGHNIWFNCAGQQ